MPVNKKMNARLQWIDEKLRRGQGNAYTTLEILNLVNEKLHHDGYATITDRTLKEDYKKLEVLLDCKIASTKVKWMDTVKTVRYYDPPNPEFTVDIKITEDQKKKLKSVLSYINNFSPFSDKYQELSISLQELLDEKDRDLDSRTPLFPDINYEYTGNRSWLNRLLHCIEDRECIRIVYQPFNKAESSIDFSPYALKQYNNRWFCLGANTNEEKMWNLALDRIKSIESSNKPYDSSLNKSYEDWQDYFDEIIGVTNFVDKDEIELVIKATGETPHYIQTKPFHNTQREAEILDDGVIFKYNLKPNFEMYQKLLQYGGHIEVLSPQEVRDEMKRIAEKMAELYG